MDGRPRILIAEDEILVSLHLSHWLARAGYDVCSLATTGEQVVQIAQAESPRLILLDVRLAGRMGGLEAASRVRVFSSVPIIFMSGYVDDEIRRQALAFQPAVYLDKPLDWGRMERAIRAGLSSG